MRVPNLLYVIGKQENVTANRMLLEKNVERVNMVITDFLTVKVKSMSFFICLFFHYTSDLI